MKPSGSGNGNGLSPADLLRLNTWTVEIALALRPGAPSREASDGLRVGRRDSLLIRPDGSWRDYTGDDGGQGALSMIVHLLDVEQHDHNPASTIQFARKWLSEHPGEGTFQAAAFDPEKADQKAKQRARFVEQVLRSLEALVGTMGDVYLTGRALRSPYPNCVSLLRNARQGESAIVGLLTMPDGTCTGVQLGFIDPQGRKSSITPQRMIFTRELDPAKRRGAAFRILATPVPAAINEALGPEQTKDDDDEPRRRARTARRFAATTLIGEGLEDALSLHTAFPYSAIIGLPGIGALRHQKFKPGDKVIVVPDGDRTDAPSKRPLERGIDELLLQRIMVRKAPMPELGEDGPKPDSNQILATAGLGALQAIVSEAAPAKLTIRGKVIELAKLSSLDYGATRRDTAKEYKVAAGFLDRQVQARRKDPEADKSGAESLVSREPQPWDGPVNLSEIFDALIALIGSLVICSKAEQLVIAVWIIHTYVAEQFTYTPRLNPLSPEPRCGKTTLINLLTHTCYRAVQADGLTPAFFMRLRSVEGPCTVLLDEMGDALHDSPELDTVLRVGFEWGKTMGRLIPMADGTFKHGNFEIFNPVAITGLRAPPAALADRCLTIRLQRKPVYVRLERLRRRVVRDRAIQIADQLARWRLDEGAGLTDDPDNEQDRALLDTLTAPLEETLSNDRQIDFCVPLLRIAHAMGGRRERRIRTAIKVVLGVAGDRSEAAGTLLLQDLLPLLDRYRKEQPKAPDSELRVPSAWLVQQLLALPESPWNGEGEFRPLTQFRLSRLIRPYGAAPAITGSKTTKTRGYRWLHLVEVCQRYFSRSTGITPLQGDHPWTSEPYQGVSGSFQGDHQGVGDHPGNSNQPVETIEMSTGDHPERGEIDARTKNAPVFPFDFNSYGKDFSLPNSSESPGFEPPSAPLAGGAEGIKPNGEDPDPPPHPSKEAW